MIFLNSAAYLVLFSIWIKIIKYCKNYGENEEETPNHYYLFVKLPLLFTVQWAKKVDIQFASEAKMNSFSPLKYIGNLID